MLEIAPSLLAADFSNLSRDIQELKEAGVNYLHLDVMDGNFVPNISFGSGLIKAIRPITDLTFDVHLMVDEPIRMIDDFVDAGADIITIHYEACTHVDRTIQEIKSKGIKAGIALNPSTPLETLNYILEEIDMVLIMSVNPGFGGQKLIKSAYKKLSDLREIIVHRDLDVIIQVDGGINTSNLGEVITRGANLIVAGSDIFKAENRSKRIKEYRDIFKEYEQV